MNESYGWGFLQPVADLIIKVMDGLYQVTAAIGFPSYALAIILISILLKLVLYPLMQKQMKSTMNMQEVQPKLEYVQKKYKNNPEKMNEEVMKLYKEYDINPMAGCLPLLIQMPILIGLFMALRQYNFDPIEHATFFWVPNLGQADPLHILPVLVALTMYAQQKVTMSASGGNEQTAQMMKTMLYMMPAMMLFVCWSMPAGLCLYWAFFSVLSIIQQYFMNKQKKKEMEARAIREAEEKEKRIAAKKAKMTAEKKAAAKQKTQIEQAEEAASEDDDADIRCIKD
ncbi:MAG: membrane protein insertase YidC [Peptococcaceae bacterium]|jgi:YidC/Oxa1 family membrane protein insertase|nr:membrane protein insertase YidC [Peptococcaceae bacterium]MBQ2369425.1 membrane protein insertase YidC [Peptococcaceae bacterium]MBQ5659484.1 membrane protein insertase YidC [Peptococcaceae bacterium]MBQ5667718.1 membrane protein insertase YidC [Peptococcaceae bacterium]MBQ5862913.1 membrane protein insertase YidC [Peptococcaceae bacterium]